MGISKNLVFYGLNPSPFSGREGYKEFLDPPIVEKALIKRITGNVSKESFKNSSVLLLRRRWDEANEKVFLKLSAPCYMEEVP